jgi:hypothetical protein
MFCNFVSCIKSNLMVTFAKMLCLILHGFHYVFILLCCIPLHFLDHQGATCVVHPNYDMNVDVKYCLFLALSVLARVFGSYSVAS